MTVTLPARLRGQAHRVGRRAALRHADRGRTRPPATGSWSLSLSASVALTVTEVSPDAATVNGLVPLVVSESSAAARVTFWLVFQLLVVNVRLAPDDTVRLESPEPAVVATVTLPDGCADRRTA